MTQLHKRFRDGQVPLNGYCQGLLARVEMPRRLEHRTSPSPPTGDLALRRTHNIVKIGFLLC
jgi:hypothetical protein